MSNEINKVVFFDTETVGLKPNYIISLSYRFYEKGKQPIIGEILCNPMYPIDPNASKVNGYTNENTANYKTFPEQWKDIEFFFRDSIWVGHNEHFDSSALSSEFIRWCLPCPHHYELDTLKMAKAMIKKNVEIENHKLITLCKHFDIVIDEDKFHGSAYDIEMTDKVFRALKKLNVSKFDNKFDSLFDPVEFEGEYTNTEPPCKHCEDFEDFHKDSLQEEDIIKINNKNSEVDFDW